MMARSLGLLILIARAGFQEFVNHLCLFCCHRKIRSFTELED